MRLCKMWTQKAYIEAIQLGLRVLPMNKMIVGFYVRETVHWQQFYQDRFYMLTADKYFRIYYRNRQHDYNIAKKKAENASYIYATHIKPNLKDDILQELEFIIRLKHGNISKRTLKEFAEYMDVKKSSILSWSELKDLKTTYLQEIKKSNENYRKCYRKERHKAILNKKARQMLKELQET